ncbi:MAG: thioredoxin domain-containing protein [Gemmatimonadaceae bacterium]|nr:thioredoxin domain-containing protein [Gemmatimonadaceae bacterium]
MPRKWLNSSIDAALIAVLGGVILYVARQQTPAGTLRLSKSDWRALTNDRTAISGSDGSVVVVEFVDYQCPVCAQVEHLFSRLHQEFPDKIRRLVRHFPIESIHPQAMVSAKAVECARRQGTMKEMHDLLLANQAAMGSIAFDTLARTVGIDTTAFSACLRAAADPQVERDVELGRSIGISGTPTVIVDGLLMTSFSPSLLMSLLKARLE